MASRLSSRRPWLLGIACLGVYACSSDLTLDDRAKIAEWLACDENCLVRLPPVTSLGNRAVATLDTTLRRAESQQREDVRRKAVATAARLGISPAAQAAVVARRVGNLDPLFQTRSAIALGTIGTTDAITALQHAIDSAAIRGYRPDVLSVIQSALFKAGNRPFGGTLTTPEAAFNDTVTVKAGTGLAFDGDETLGLIGSPFPQELVVAQSPDSVSFVAIGDVGPHAVVIRRLGPADADSQVTELRITRIGYEPKAPNAAPDMTTPGPFPPGGPLYLALATRGSDTTDHFRVEALAGPLTVRAVAEWEGLTRVTLSWRNCTSPYGVFSPGGPTASVEGRIVDVNGVGVGAAQVRIAPLAITAITDGAGGFTMSPIPTSSVWELRVQKIGSPAASYSAHAGHGTHLLTFQPPGVTDATARNRRELTSTLGVGSCRILRVSAPSPEIVRLRFIP